MENSQRDLNRALMLDGHAAEGVLREIVTMEMTASYTECGHCGREGALGTLLAFTQAPGIVLCCAACAQVMIRVVRTPRACYLNARCSLPAA